ncbi:hypothetical protein GUITHDRAFT_114247 [Guillardia theta CCMP2712]|uniref:Uncharacterized protein n=1 Tax=Guillardia theta (strain CCMP2712) TaxID=905079 RepID=L1IU10_GUITC|nr:hypothetical protein GUITHDRAFT_114247 [Guillardia theta CCMP2712]EKX39751.1 hypothetical protein GUITHDRAFT_114247 [Guillardia theta CCMP2712]|eukprot:XP_005826731.1 hypothetical protein GUITHDRAFT_114247 [Guillardia theta CCMP2712]
MSLIKSIATGAIAHSKGLVVPSLRPPLLQNASSISRASYSAMSPMVETMVAPSQTQKVKLVIFDKDGTLISFDATWSKWADDLISRFVSKCGEQLRTPLADTLGYDMELRKVRGEKSLMAWAAQPLIRKAVEACLTEQGGMKEGDAREAVRECWAECEEGEVSPISRCTKTLFQTLHRMGIMTGVCTSDARRPTELNLRSLGISSMVHHSICGDDSFNVPKPAPDNAWNFCKKLGTAGVAGSIGVLSGVGTEEDLRGNADVIVESVDSVIELVR